MSDVYLHPGIPKTATTTLQNHLFAKHSEINNLGKPFGNQHVKSFLRNITTQGQLFYSCSKQRERFERHVKPMFTDECPNVISMEGLTSYFTEVVDLGLIVRRLHNFFPEATVLITLRNQFDFLRSQYTQWLNLFSSEVEFPSFEQWLERRWFIHKADSTTHQFQLLCYDSLVKAYLESFNSGAVKVFLFEKFKKHPEKFITEMASRIGVDSSEAIDLISEKEKANTRKTKVEYLYRSIRSQIPFSGSFGEFIPDVIRNRVLELLRIGPRLDPELKPVWRRRIGQIVVPENNAISARLDLNLEKHGYPMDVEKL